MIKFAVGPEEDSYESGPFDSLEEALEKPYPMHLPSYIWKIHEDERAIPVRTWDENKREWGK